MAFDPKLNEEFERLQERLKGFGSPDFYQAIRLPRDATDEQIKSNYRKKARQYHPDIPDSGKPADAEARLIAINLVYEILSDPDKRASYDTWLSSSEAHQGRRAPGPTDPSPADTRRQQRADDRARRGAEREAKWQQRSGVNGEDFASYKKEAEDVFRRAQAVGDMPTDDDFEAMWNIHNRSSSSAGRTGSRVYQGPQKITVKWENLPRILRVENSSIDVVLEACDGSEMTIDGKFDKYEPQGDYLSLRNLDGKITVPRSAYGMLELIVETGSGNVEGRIATSARIKTSSGNVQLQVEALLNYELTVEGRVIAETPVGPHDYKVTGSDIGTLKIETSTGYAKVKADARQGAAR